MILKYVPAPAPIDVPQRLVEDVLEVLRHVDDGPTAAEVVGTYVLLRYAVGESVTPEPDAPDALHVLARAGYAYWGGPDADWYLSAEMRPDWRDAAVRRGR